jgi:hypothetical protein
MPNCDYCGQFVPVGADHAIPFGNSNDFEPPDPVFFCPRCVAEKMETLEYVPTFWVPAEWHLELALKLGYWRAGPEGAAWGRWTKIDQPLPEGYEWRELVGWEEYTPE